ncbi:restriction endonuclease subunit S [Dietzia sp. SL131]|uniref:restriction endonuclease subunit S n=1 Tax=Dietzia sp. SL131 TaxID=2995149 RepID=UPI00227A8A8B|nr:restriction endonuclease subunit S [Dietzia sp. SL131]MCY1658780.1 restriction endonuclease subunit S [Dietzia sp. SL131]
MVRGGDLVVSIGPAYGKVALLEDDLSGSNLTQDTVRVAPVRSSVDPEFLVWALDSYEAESFWDAEITGATFRRLNLGTLGQTPIPLPDLRTQRDIRDRLDETTDKVDTLIAKSTEMIETLREYRSALITNAVTGKIDVREAV